MGGRACFNTQSELQQSGVVLINVRPDTPSTHQSVDEDEHIINADAERQEWHHRNLAKLFGIRRETMPQRRRAFKRRR